MYLSEIKGRTPVNFKSAIWRYNKRVKKNKCLDNSCQIFQKYSKMSTLHGLRYIGDAKLSICERLLFLIIFLSVLLLSIFYIIIVWEKWTKSPIIITYSPVSTKIVDIPFPTVTICNMNQANNFIAKSIQK